jgi:hypothetical protein
VGAARVDLQAVLAEEADLQEDGAEADRPRPTGK